jgi:GAF domain-containing protein
MGDVGSARSAEKLLETAESVRGAPEALVAWHEGSSASPSIGRLLQATPFQSLLGLTLSIRGEPLGALLFLNKKGQRLSAEHRRKLIHLGNQAAVAVENLQLFESTQRRLLEVADLNWVSTRISASHDMATIAAIVADAASNTLDAPRVALFLQQEDGRFETISRQEAGSEPASERTLDPEGHIGAEALSTGSAVAVSDAEAEGRALDPLVQRLHARSLLCAPMTAQQGLRGFFVIADDRPRVFRSHDIGVLSNYSNQAALALQSAMLYQNTMRHLDEISRLFDISRGLASSLNLKDNLSTILTSAAKLLNAPVCSVMLSDSETGELAVNASYGLADDDQLYERIRPGEGLAGRAFQAGVPLTSGDLSRDGRFKFRQTARERGLRTAIAAPLIARGHTVGVLNLYRTCPGEFTEDDKRLLTSLAHSAAVAIENANLYQEAQQRADFLSAMMSEINHRIRNTLQAIAGLLRMELDRPQVSAESAIRRGISRIQAVAVVHELMRARELQFVDMKQVARRIVEIMCQSISLQRPIDSVISGARVTLPSQRATSVALIFAELIDNALRHGLQNTPDGRISIGLAEGGGEVVVYVKDNGVGLPDGFDLDTNSGFGLRIVRGLVEEELGGRVEIESGEGLLVRFRFPKL